MATSADQNTMSIIYSKFDSYPFSADAQFQAGLNTILSSAPGDDAKSHIELKAKIYYFARKFSIPPFSAEDYQAWKSSQQVGPSLSQGEPSSKSNEVLPSEQSAEISSSSAADISKSSNTESAAPSDANDSKEEDDDDPPRLTYAELVNLIQSGAPIPGIKDIPDTVLSGQGTEATASKRRKPWEKETSSGDTRTEQRLEEVAPAS